MSEFRHALEELSRWPASPEPALGRLLSRHRRRRAAQRAAAGALSLVVAALGLGYAFTALHGSERPANPELTASTVGQLRLAWTGSVGGGASAPVMGGDEVLVGTNQGAVLAFNGACGEATRRCTPTWFGSTGGFPAHVATQDGIAYASGRGVFAFREGCRRDGHACSPLWTSGLSNFGHSYSAPAVAGGVVYVGTPDGRVLAYPAACGYRGATCRPLWIGVTDSGTGVGQPAVDGNFVFAVSDQLYAFRVGCGSAGERCRPVWSAPIGTITSNPPAVAGGIVVVASDRVSAFPVDCSAPAGRCPPLWTYAPDGAGSFSAPTIYGETVYVGGSRVVALPLDCESSSPCHPRWVGPAEAGFPFSRPTVARGLIFASAARVYAFDIGCRGTCRPMWTSPALGGVLSAPLVERDALFVTSSEGTLSAFLLAGRRSPAP